MANRLFVDNVKLIINFDLHLDGFNSIKRMRNGGKIITLYYDTEINKMPLSIEEKNICDKYWRNFFRQNPERKPMSILKREILNIMKLTNNET